jgi:hypothetical protein
MSTNLTPQQRRLIQLMDTQYQRIRDIEERFSILGLEGDYRPRIEYYQDAVRALMSGEDNGLDRSSRLSAERIAWDLSMLRHIQAKPVIGGRGQQHLSPHSEVAKSGKHDRRPSVDRESREALKKQYKDYTVLYVALLAEKADRNATNRIEEMNVLVEDCEMLKSMMEQLSRGEITIGQLIQMLDQIEHDELREALQQMLAARGIGQDEMGAALDKVEHTSKAADKEIKRIDDAMLSLSASQLAVYEASKDMVKGLAGQGLNIAGKHVENAMSQGAGKGRGI